jgi:hypothetical protein
VDPGDAHSDATEAAAETEKEDILASDVFSWYCVSDIL